MQDNFFERINVSTKLLVLTLINLSILISNSLYLIIFFSILLIMLLIITEQNVNQYVELIKKNKFILLFVFIAYIIVLSNILRAFIFVCKVILLIFFIKQFCNNLSFQRLNNGIKTLLKFMEKKFNVDVISYNISIFVYFLIFYGESKKEIFLNYDSLQKIKYTFSLKYNILPRLFYTMEKIKNLEFSLKLKCYKAHYEKNNFESIFFLIIFNVLFIMVVFKEVIL